MEVEEWDEFVPNVQLDLSQIPIDVSTNFGSDEMDTDEIMIKMRQFKHFFEEKKKEIETFHRWKEMIYLHDANVLYHGSSIENKERVLYPYPSHVLNGESAVFATPDRTLALLFCSPWNDQDLAVGYVNDQLVVKENKPNAFDTFFKNKSGYLYLVSADTFENDDRLGMQSHEFISKISVPILGELYVPDLWQELNSVRCDVQWFPFTPVGETEEIKNCLNPF